MGHIIDDYEMLVNDGIPGIRGRINKLSTDDGEALKTTMIALAGKL